MSLSVDGVNTEPRSYREKIQLSLVSLPLLEENQNTFSSWKFLFFPNFSGAKDMILKNILSLGGVLVRDVFLFFSVLLLLFFI